MVFRADEAARANQESAERYLLSRLTDLSATERSRSREVLLDLFIDLGAVVDSYPTWHPLVSNTKEGREATTPRSDCGYKGLDHTVYFAHGFITCPYDDGERVIDSVNVLYPNHAANITAERLDVKFYSSQATSILVKCNWNKPLANDGTIPLSIALPLFLQSVLPYWKTAQLAETWDSMRPDVLGSPCGKRSSLFINQETGQAMKKIWEVLINSGMYGPIRV